MLRTAPNFSNSTNRVPVHSSRHQTSANFAGFLLKREHNSPLCSSSLLGNRLVRASPQQASCCRRVVSCVVFSIEIRQSLQMFDASNCVLGPYLYPLMLCQVSVTHILCAAKDLGPSSCVTSGTANSIDWCVTNIIPGLRGWNVWL